MNNDERLLKCLAISLLRIKKVLPRSYKRFLTIQIILIQEKCSFSEINEHCEISIKSIKNYSDNYFVEKLGSIKFSDNSNHTWMNDACQNFVTKFLSAADSVLPIRTLRVKSNTKL